MNYSILDCRLHRKPPASATRDPERQLTTVLDRAGRRHLILHRAGMPLRRGFRLLAQIGVACMALLGMVDAGLAQFVIQPLTEATSKDAKIYGTLPANSLGSDLSVVSQDVGAHFLSLVQFDLSSVSLTSLEISNATLTLYSTGLGISGGPVVGGTVTISPILDDWRETAGSPGTAPLSTYSAFFGATPTLHFGSAVASQTVSGAGFVDWDITNLVKAWKDGSQQNYGVIIQLSTGGGDVGFADVDSALGVAGSQPKLTVAGVPEPGSTLLALTGLGVMILRRKRTAAR